MRRLNRILDTKARYFRVLANPKRLYVVHLLQYRRLTVTDMERLIGIRQANLSQHLMILRRAGIVTTEHKGRKVYYSLGKFASTLVPTTFRFRRDKQAHEN